jgi:hypothetical protein
MQVYEALVLGAGAGLVSASLMTLVEAPFWRKIGISGVVEWQVNLVMVSWLLHEQYDPRKRLPDALGMHVLHGAVFGALLGGVLNLLAPLSPFGDVAAAEFMTLILWSMVPLLLWRPFMTATGARFSRIGLLISLIGHLVYGFALGEIIAVLMG